jgi:hypothetical protein
MATKDRDKRIIKIVLTILEGEDGPTDKTLHQAVDDVVEMFQKRKEVSDEEPINLRQLTREIETMCNIHVPYNPKIKEYVIRDGGQEYELES